MDYEKLSRIEVRTGTERQIKSYVLRSNKIDEKEKAVFDAYGDQYMVFFEDDAKIDLHELFGNDNPVVVEIGFGMGDSTLKIAAIKPDVNYLCLEVYIPGVVKLLKGVGDLGLENVKIMRFNAVDVLEKSIEPGSVDGFHIFFPDPWQKKKHHKRRLIQPPFVSLLSSRLKKGGYIYCVTDWEEYAEQMLEVLSGEETLQNKYDGYAEPVSWRPTTKFEKKGLDKEHVIHEVWFERK